MIEILGFLIGTIVVIVLLLYGAWHFFLGGSLKTAILEFFNVMHDRDHALEPGEHLSHRDREPLSDLVEQRAHRAKQTMSIQRGDAMATPNTAPQAPQPPQAIQGQAAPVPSVQPAPHNAEVKQLVDNKVPSQPTQQMNPPTAQPVPPQQPVQQPPQATANAAPPPPATPDAVPQTQPANVQSIPPPSPPAQTQAFQAAPLPPAQTRRHPGHAVPPLVETHSFGVSDPIIDDIHIEPGTPSADTLNAQPPAFDSSRFGVRSSTISPGRRLRDKRYRRNASS